MSQSNESQQKATALQHEVDTFIAENLTQEMIEGARLGFGINRDSARGGIKPFISADGSRQIGPSSTAVPAGASARNRSSPMPWRWLALR